MKAFNEIKAGDTIWTVDWGYTGFLICPVVPTIRVSSYVVKEIFIGENCVAFTTNGLVCGALKIGKALMCKESAHQGELAKSYYADRALMEEDIRNYWPLMVEDVRNYGRVLHLCDELDKEYQPPTR